ncbi:hypothetical protein [Shewanella carassii]|uniref:Uncharacterized protein n=1 Tax=Shewanella carassii TaxID=1987584 RepID=A0ABQ1TIW3_9GAMM|nr:hypothetical protein [Shewanella carassii]GGE94501.1 hypothetical protein GCM10011520_38520 [Shewanella carassii]
MEYDREADLSHRLNTFLSETFGLPNKDYYSQLDAEGFISLKSALSDINNILTLKVTLSFADWLSQHYNLDSSAKAELERIVLEAKPNSNGYDVWLGYPVSFVGEVKCNIPINNGLVYGSAQRAGIEKDVNGMLKGKRKASINPEKCPKFLAFLDLPQIRSANEHLSSVSGICKEHLVFTEMGQELDRLDVVYGVYVSINA